MDFLCQMFFSTPITSIPTKEAKRAFVGPCLPLQRLLNMNFKLTNVRKRCYILNKVVFTQFFKNPLLEIMFMVMPYSANVIYDRNLRSFYDAFV